MGCLGVQAGGLCNDWTNNSGGGQEKRAARGRERAAPRALQEGGIARNTPVLVPPVPASGAEDSGDDRQALPKPQRQRRPAQAEQPSDEWPPEELQGEAGLHVGQDARVASPGGRCGMRCEGA